MLGKRKTMALLGAAISCAALAAPRASAATVEGNVDAQKLLDWVDAQKKVAGNVAVQSNGKDMNNGGAGFCLQCSNDQSKPTAQAKTVSLYQTGQAVFYDADMDIDCDGSNNGVCGGTDPSHQNLLSCDDNSKCSKDNGGPIDAATSAFYVIPVGSPFSYASRGIGIGQLAAIINRKTTPPSIIYATFLDEDGVSQEIGEASAYAASLLGVPNDPNTGGQGSGITYIVFRGAAARFTSVADMANHQKAITVGQGLAAQLVAAAGLDAAPGASGSALEACGGPQGFSLSVHGLRIDAAGAHAVKVVSPQGNVQVTQEGVGPAAYDFSALPSGLYLVDVAIGSRRFTRKLAKF